LNNSKEISSKKKKKNERKTGTKGQRTKKGKTPLQSASIMAERQKELGFYLFELKRRK